jgi:hypothetical protein
MINEKNNKWYECLLFDMTAHRSKSVPTAAAQSAEAARSSL